MWPKDGDYFLFFFFFELGHQNFHTFSFEMDPIPHGLWAENVSSALLCLKTVQNLRILYLFSIYNGGKPMFYNIFPSSWFLQNSDHKVDILSCHERRHGGIQN